MTETELKNKRKALHKVRGICPYLEPLASMAQYHKTGESINIFEIGVLRGSSTRALLRGLANRRLSTGHLYSVDIAKRENVVREADHEKLWTFFHGDSQEIQFNKKIDILFIDGCHKYDAVKADYERYEPMVEPGGYIAMHDVTCRGRGFGVYKFWEEIDYPKIILKYNSVGLGIVSKPI